MIRLARKNSVECDEFYHKFITPNRKLPKSDGQGLLVHRIGDLERSRQLELRGRRQGVRPKLFAGSREQRVSVKGAKLFVD